jgi:hypothetical protein
MQEAEGKLPRSKQQNMKKDYTQSQSVIDESYKLIQKLRLEPMEFEWSGEWFHETEIR